MIDSSRLFMQIVNMTAHQLARAKRYASRIESGEVRDKFPDFDGESFARIVFWWIERRERQLCAAHLWSQRKDKAIHWKKCPVCQSRRPVDNSYFGFGKTKTGNPQSRCKSCYRAENHKFHKNNPQVGRERASRNQSDRNYEPIDKKFREAVRATRKEQQANACAYCGGVLEASCEIDHYIPLSKGGSNEISNLVLACVTCNRQKHNHTPEEFIIFMKKKKLAMRKGGFFNPRKPFRRKLALLSIQKQNIP